MAELIVDDGVKTTETTHVDQGVGRSRVERDFLGTRQLDGDCYYGISTQRALENFPITGKTIGDYPQFVNALVLLKQAAATVNGERGLLRPEVTHAIIAACKRIRSGQLHDQFAVGTIQGGAGTSTNMNVNEVVANAALEELGLAKGRYDVVNPHNDVNRCQSTNDVYPSAIKIALLLMLDPLCEALRRNARAFDAKAEEFRDVLKLGRTQLQDAVPMTLGQEMAGYAVMMREGASALTASRELLKELNLGGTAIGTGINTTPGYAT